MTYIYAHQFEFSVLVRNILAVYALRSADDARIGSNWYPANHKLVCEWSEHFGRSIANVASVIAALSPQCEWNRNLVIADDILHGNPPSVGGALHVNVRKAERIRDERLGNTLTVFTQGPKVASFAANLAGNFMFVTVDTHCAQVAAGAPEANMRIDTWKRYEPVSHAYRCAASHVGLPPAILQSIVWHTWKRIYPHKQNQRREF